MNGRPAGIAAGAATALAVAATAGIGLSAVMVGMDSAEWASLAVGNGLAPGAMALPYAGIGALVVSQDRRHVLGWVFVALGQLCTAATLGAVWADRGIAPHAVAVVLSAFAWIPAVLLQIAVPALYFPSGRLPSPRWRPLAYLAWAVVGFGAVAQVFLGPPLEDYDPALHNPLRLEQLAPAVSLGIFGVLLALALGCLLSGLAGLVLHTRGARGRQAAALWWFAGTIAVAVAASFAGPTANLAGALAIPLGLGLATLRYGLYDGDRWMGRPALHAAASVVLLVVLAVPAGLLAAHAAGSAVGAVLAAVIVAGGFVPLQAWAGRLLDRLLFGGRAGPYATLARLGHSLGQAPAAETVLPLLVDTIASCLHLPYVAVQLAGENTPAASIGQAFGPIESLPLVHGGRQVGTLQIGVPAGRRVLDARDAGLLRDVAAQAGPAVGAVSLNRQLARSRERLARTSEEERQRIRRNLHDGLGPTLAGVALGIEASHRAALRAGVDVGLEGIHRDVLAGLDDLKRLLAQLRPASLDELGLAGSLREHAAALAAVGTMALEVRGSSNAGLPVALEVAAYFIGREAMNNAVRHSGGSLCTVSLAVGNALDLQISDDGCGPDDSWVPGVGLGSMAERARELGGECAVEPNPGGGTRVRVWIPVPL